MQRLRFIVSIFWKSLHIKIEWGSYYFLDIKLWEWYILPYYSNMENANNREYNHVVIAFLCFYTSFPLLNKTGKVNEKYRKDVLSGKIK